MMKWFARGALLGTLLIVSIVKFGGSSGTQALTRSTAMITNLAANSGGTGVVIASSKAESKVLTNAHVCGVVKNGGLVQTDFGKGTASYYQVSEAHDLCLITVETYLGPAASIASSPPSIYSEANVAGHPALLPTIVTRGHFSDKQIIQVMTGFRECTEEDLKSDAGILLCAFLGGIPVIKTYQAQVVSATIMPGSSGSAVYNSSGEVSGLVFAGSGSLSYGFIVPQEYVRNFVDNELPNLEKHAPRELDLLAKINGESKAKLETACEKLKLGDKSYGPIGPYCNFVNSGLIF